MKNDIIYPSAFSIILFIGVSFFVFSQCGTVNENFDAQSNSTLVDQTNHEKQKGAHVFGRMDSTNLQPFIQNNIEWITLVPYSDQKDIDSPNVRYYRGDSLNMVRRNARWKNKINLAHSLGFKVFLKPHIWLYEPSDGKWRSDIFPSNDANWKSWKKSYREFILLYAKIAQDNNVELFCIGAELTRLTIEKSDFWIDLIQEVKGIYKGKITYAANWYKEYEEIKFWDKLDYIGIQAYFPLVKNKYPSVQQISKGWNKYIPTMQSIHKKYNRQILFTEMGYKSTADSAIDPWAWVDRSSNQNKSISVETQANCYQAFFDTIWKKNWFAGIHIWQMRSDFIEDDGKYGLDFAPQGKPAEKIIAKGFE